MKRNRNGRANSTIIVVVVLVVVAAIAFWLLRGCGLGNGPPVVLPPVDSALRKQVDNLAADARKLQSEKNFEGALAKWKDVKRQINEAGNPLELAPLSREATENLKTLEPLLSKTGPPTAVFARDRTKIKDPPAKIGRDALKKYYPPGRTVRSTAELVIRGQGSNKDWGLKGVRHFVAIDMAVAETKVLSKDDDDGHRVSFEVAFKDVSHNLFHSDETLELDPPDSPFLETFWPPLEREVLDYVPVYRVLKTNAELVNLVDPRLKRTLTALNKRLKRLGVPLNTVDDVQYISLIERLAGMRVELEYVDGVGVVSIKVLDGPKLPPEDLEALAECSGPMLDYFIFPGAVKKPGDPPWDVRAQDVASLVRLSYRYTVSGKIELERDKDEKGLAVLKVRGGEITALGRGSDADEHYELAVNSGFVKYSIPDLLATEGKLQLRFKQRIASRDHLLFDMENLRDVEVEAHYLAERTPAGSRSR